LEETANSFTITVAGFVTAVFSFFFCPPEVILTTKLPLMMPDVSRKLSS
jgi:hypothetical protein